MGTMYGVFIDHKNLLYITSARSNAPSQGAMFIANKNVVYYTS